MASAAGLFISIDRLQRFRHKNPTAPDPSLPFAILLLNIPIYQSEHVWEFDCEPIWSLRDINNSGESLIIGWSIVLLIDSVLETSTLLHFKWYLACTEQLYFEGLRVSTHKNYNSVIYTVAAFKSYLLPHIFKYGTLRGVINHKMKWQFSYHTKLSYNLHGLLSCFFQSWC